MNKKELAKKLVADKAEAITNSGTELLNALARLDKQYEEDKERVDKPFKWPLTGDTGFTLSAKGQIRDESYTLCNDAYARGAYHNTREEADLHDERRLAEIRVTRRIAKINLEDDWEADWRLKGHLKYYLIADSRGIPGQGVTEIVRSHPPHWYGCERAIKTVIKELPGDCKTMLGVEDE